MESYSLRISDGESADTLHFGLDPMATNGIDPDLNEYELPPSPPFVGFYSRFVGEGLSPIVPIGLGLYRDYRNGDTSTIGSVMHRVNFRPGVSQNTIRLSWWDIHPKIRLRFQDVITGTLIDTVVEGGDSGSYLITNPTGFNALFITVNYLTVRPVELISFRSTIIDNDVNLFWETSKELNNMGFEVHRLKDGIADWTNIGFVQGHFNTNENKSYRFTDKNLQSGSYKYRLKQIDVNGNFEYFNLTETVVIGIPQEIFLSQNYPNPFNPETVINYKLSSGDHVALGIYDASGKLIRYLVNEYKPAGYYEVSLNSDVLPSGVYYYNMETSGRVISRKMLILK
jgi:hypothetical protein